MFFSFVLFPLGTQIHNDTVSTMEHNDVIVTVYPSARTKHQEQEVTRHPSLIYWKSSSTIDLIFTRLFQLIIVSLLIIVYKLHQM